jgi:hypothetical protein
MNEPFCGVVSVLQSGIVIEKKLNYNSLLDEVKELCGKDLEHFRKKYPGNFIKIEFKELVGSVYLHYDLRNSNGRK